MDRWLQIRDDYSKWLRAFPLLANIGKPGPSREIIAPQDAPVYLNVQFWSARTHEAEARALLQISNADIDQIIDDVSAVIDEDLLRFDPLITYFARFFPDGHAGRIEDERTVAHCVKRDLAWAAIERVIRQPGFFSLILDWYANGRWPCDWNGQYPAGHVLVL
jgi:hypothetical protein